MNITDEKVTEYIQDLYRPLNAELGELRRIGTEQKIPILAPETETILRSLIQIRKPKSVLEIGTAIGYSASCFAAACDCIVTTIELRQDMARLAFQNIEQLGYANRIKILQGDAKQVLDTVSGPFDFVFIDGAKSHYRTFWDKIITRCTEGAVIVCDNVLLQGMTVSDAYLTARRNKTSMRKMREFLTYINGLETVDTSVLPVGDGLSISILKG